MTTYTRALTATALDVLAVCRADNVPLDDLALRLGVTQRRLYDLARDPRHSHRVRMGLFELLLEREKLRGIIAAS